MLLKEVDSCEDCPLNGEYCYANGNVDAYAPCQDDEYHNMEIEDVKHDIFMRQCRYEENEDRRIQREEAKQAKNDAIKAKRQQTAWKNRVENNEIKYCKDRIKKLTGFKESLESISSLASAMSFFNGNSSTIEKKPKSPKIIEVENKIAEYEARIVELKKIKKNKA